jgi:hypothetical protein
VSGEIVASILQRLAERHLGEPLEPWWHSVSCICRRCLISDGYAANRAWRPGERPLFPVR